MDFLTDLNPEQRQAAEHVDGPLLVIAGAGSGKTRVLTYRIANLIRQHRTPPHSILAVTFTNKAAQEMRERVSRLIGSVGQYVWISTFHSAALKILRRHAEKLGYQRSFAIFDDGDQKTVIKKILAEMKISDRALSPQAVQSAIDAAKNELLSPELYISQPMNFLEERVGEIYQRYQALLKENNAVDFGDIIMQTVRLLETSPEIAETYAASLKYLLVDEYQDTNPAQYRLLYLLSGGDRHSGPRNLFVVGDEDQAIYGWRGGDIRIIMRFERDFPGARLLRLERNYRSTALILDASNHLVSCNRQRKGKVLWTDQTGGEKIVYCTTVDEHGEGAFICQQIRDLQGIGAVEKYSEVAIFYRTNAQSRVLEDELRRAAIPYRIIGGTRFYDRAEIKDAVAYLRVLANPKDNINLMRIINKPARGLGQTTLAKLIIFAEIEKASVLEVLMDGRFDHCPDLSSGTKTKLKLFRDLMVNLQTLVASNPVPVLTKKILDETGYLQALEAERTIEAESRMENLRELLAGMEEYEEKFVPTEEDSAPNLRHYLDQITLANDSDKFDENAGVVSLMTIHLAKGLEFPVVFIAGMEEGLFPHSRALARDDELEEERRLCYVAMTRAKKRLLMVNAYSRRVYGAEQFNVASRFCDEIPAKFIERINEVYEAPRRHFIGDEYAQVPVQFSNTNHSSEEQSIDYSSADDVYDAECAPTAHLTVGKKVRHSEFGVGVISSREGSAQNMKVVVHFQGQGRKKLLVRSAKLEVIR